MSNTLPPIQPTVASWEEWRRLTDQAPPVILDAMRDNHSLQELGQQRAQWTAYVGTIYPWNAGSIGDWRYVKGGIDALMAQFAILVHYQDVLSQRRAYWALFDVTVLLRQYLVQTGALARSESPARPSRGRHAPSSSLGLIFD